MDFPRLHQDIAYLGIFQQEILVNWYTSIDLLITIFDKSTY